MDKLGVGMSTRLAGPLSTAEMEVTVKLCGIPSMCWVNAIYFCLLMCMTQFQTETTPITLLPGTSDHKQAVDHTKLGLEPTRCRVQILGNTTFLSLVHWKI